MPWVRRVSRLSRSQVGLGAWITAFILFSAGLSLRLLFASLHFTFMTFYPAVAVTTLICGFPQGTIVLFLSAASSWYLFSEPIHPFEFNDAANIEGLIGFLLVGGSIIVLIAALSEAVKRVELAKAIQETLFKELQHRVANNLQLVVVLLRNAQRNLRNPVVAAETLNDAEERIIAMSLLHRRLQDGTAFASGLEPLLKEILAHAFRDLPVEVRVDIKGASNLSLDQMTAITLLVSEAALNSVKHVFSMGQGTHFNVALSKEVKGHLRLIIEDDGPGMGSKIGSEKTRGLGMGIMEAFATQLGGSLQVANTGGTSLSVEFRDSPRPDDFVQIRAVTPSTPKG